MTVSVNGKKVVCRWLKHALLCSVGFGQRKSQELPLWSVDAVRELKIGASCEEPRARTRSGPKPLKFSVTNCSDACQNCCAQTLRIGFSDGAGSFISPLENQNGGLTWYPMRTQESLLLVEVYLEEHRIT